MAAKQLKTAKRHSSQHSFWPPKGFRRVMGFHLVYILMHFDNFRSDFETIYLLQGILTNTMMTSDPSDIKLFGPKRINTYPTCYI